MIRRSGGIAPARGLREANEIEQAEDAGDRSECREAGCQEDGDGRAGAAGWSGETEDQRDQGGTDGLPEQSRGRLDGTGAAASFARCADVMSVHTALVRFTYPRQQLGRGIAVTAVAVSMPAAPTPCRARPTASIASECDSALTRAASVNTTRPIVYMRRYPKMSPTDASGSSAITTASDRKQGQGQRGFSAHQQVAD